MMNTKYGFNFGSMKVTRVYGDNKAHCIKVDTPKKSFSVRATPTGLVRFFDEKGVELKLVKKD